MSDGGIVFFKHTGNLYRTPFGVQFSVDRWITSWSALEFIDRAQCSESSSWQHARPRGMIVPMGNRLHSMRVIVAFVAWLAQLCLPMAHAASMASTGLGTAAWCGQNAPALRAKLAELPSEIRHILEDSVELADHADDCAQFCATAGGPAAPEPGSMTVALRAAGLESSPVTTPPPELRSFGTPPPARGPPASL